MSEAVQLSIVGQCASVVEKPSGWVEFHIMKPGNQYPVRLATKLEQLIEEGRAVKDQIATWTYNETEGDINPKSGKPYINRYFEGVALGDHGDTSKKQSGATSSEGPSPHHEAVHYADKDRLISRQVCLKVAGTVFSGQGIQEVAPGPVTDVGMEVMKLAQRLELWLYRDIDPVPF